MSRSITLTKNDTPRRWHSPSGFILIRQMDDRYLLNAISWAIRRKGHKIKKFQALVDEAIRRKLPLPQHKWVTLPEGYAAGDFIEGEIDEGVYNPALRD